MIARTVLVVAALTLQEAARRKVLRALAVLTAVLLGLSAWGFSRIAAEFDGFTTGESMVTSSIILNLVMFGLSLIAALGTAFLAGPTLSGEIESGIALAMMTRPVRRSAVLVGKWLGLAVFGSGFIVVAGLAQLIIVRITVGYWPPQPVAALAMLAAQTTVLLTLGMLLSTVISPMASGIVAVGLFGATWIAGIVGTVGELFNNEDVARVGTVSRMLLPTDGLWRGAMYSLQHPALMAQFGSGVEESPLLSMHPPTALYLAWAGLWVLAVLGLAAVSFGRRDL